jgi:hypothetical protein
MCAPGVSSGREEGGRVASSAKLREEDMMVAIKHTSCALEAEARYLLLY